MVSFIALYRGRTLSDAELVGVSVSRDLIHKACDVMLTDIGSKSGTDPVTASISDGRRKALEMVRQGPARRT